MASLSGDRRTALTIGKTGFLFTVHDLLEAVGKWDLYGMQETGQIKQTVLAWNATHLHRGDADSYGEQAYFFKYTFEIPAGAKSFTLPLDQNLLLLAASGTDLPACRTAAPLYDTLKKREFDFWITEKDRRLAHPGMLSKAAGFLKIRRQLCIPLPAKRNRPIITNKLIQRKGARCSTSNALLFLFLRAINAIQPFSSEKAAVSSYVSGQTSQIFSRSAIKSSNASGFCCGLRKSEAG